MKKITVSILTTLLMLSMVFSSSVFAANEKVSAWDSFLGLSGVKATETSDVGVEYRGHVENKGDFPLDGSWIQGPNRLGTVGEGLRLEAFWIKLTDAPEGLHIKYEVHVQNKGWMAPVEDGKLAGTQAEGLRIEAIKISLVDDEGNVSGDYSVTYKGHIQNEGDTDWIKSGLQLGTTGSGLRLEALEVKIEKIAPDLSDYEAALAAVTEANYTKASWATYQDVVEDNVMTEDNVQSEVDAATAIILDAQEDLVTVPVIAGMSATAQKQITVTGTQLDKLSASMLAVTGNTVVSVTPNADGTSAVVVLGTDLTPETNTTVTATVDGTATQYTVKYTIAAVTAAIQETTFDDDKANQSLTVLVDGVATTPAYLVAQGYTVTFNAWNANGTANTILVNATTGAINVPATIDDYTVQVTLAKGSSVVTSAKATIKVRDLDNNADAISAYQVTNQNATTPFVMNSKTLYSGETAFVNKVVVGYGSAAAELTTTFGTAGNFDVTSSNAAVIAVNSTTKTMTAVGLGTADITITVGDAKTTVTLTVVGEQRKIATVTGSSFTSIKGAGAVSNEVIVKDQYGDPFIKASSSLSITGPSITGVTLNTASPVTAFTNAEGKLNISMTNATATAGSTGVVVFRDADSNVVGSFNVATSDVNNQTTKKLSIDTSVANSSTDNTMDTDLASDRMITFKVGLYNSDGVANGSVTDLTGYSVTFNGTIISVEGNTNTTASTTSPYTFTNAGGADTRLVVRGLKAGSTTMVVKDNTGNVIDTRTIIVLKGTPYISAITFKTTSTINYATTINFKNVLNLTETTNDDIVNNVTLSTGSVYKVRIQETNTFAGSATTPVGALGNFYLDRNDDGIYNEGDFKLGTFGISQVVDTTGTAWATAATEAIAGRAVTAGNKGTVTFTLTDTVSSTPVIRGTGTVTVNVPTAPGAAVTGLSTTEFGPAIPTQTAATTEAGAAGWTSSNAAVATVNAGTGVISFVGAGSTVISYTTSTSGLVNSATLVVTPAVAPVLTYSATGFTPAAAGVKTFTLTSNEALKVNSAGLALSPLGAANSLATFTAAGWTTSPATFKVDDFAAGTTVTFSTDALAASTGGSAPTAITLGTGGTAVITDAVGNPATAAVTVTP